MSGIFNRYCVSVLALLFAMATPSFALIVTVNGDVNGAADANYTGLGAAPDLVTNTHWNDLQPSGTSYTSGPLTASDNTTSTLITVTFTGASLAVFENIGTGSGRLMGDFIHPSPGAFSFNNLSATTSYDLYIYSQNGSFTNETTTFTIDDMNMTAANAGTTFGAFVVNATYVKYTGLVPIDGAISGTFVDSGIPANGSALDGFQLVYEVPEPASLGLLMLGGAVLLKRRRHA